MSSGRARPLSLAFVAVLAFAGAARADIDASVRVDGVPDGSLRYGDMGRASSDLSPGYGIGAEVRYVTQTYALGVAPRFVRFGNTPDVDREVDLAARIAARRELTSVDAVEVCFALGYSMVSVADGNDTRGFLAGTAATYERGLAARVSAVLEAGYQYGFQTRSAQAGEPAATAAPRFVHAGLGVRARF